MDYEKKQKQKRLESGAKAVEAEVHQPGKLVKFNASTSGDRLVKVSWSGGLC